MLAPTQRALNCSSILLAVAKYLMNLHMGAWREHGTNHRFAPTVILLFTIANILFIIELFYPIFVNGSLKRLYKICL